jgi:hypothetical protein
MPPIPDNKKLYNKIKSIAKKKFKAWPSAYASGWLVKEYKRQGGTYSGEKSKKTGLPRWFSEKWIDACAFSKGRIKSCGRPSSNISMKEWIKKYPYCRPMKRITSQTPKTVYQISKKELEKRCKSKRRNPSKKIQPSKRKSRKKTSRRKTSRKTSRKPSKTNSRKSSKKTSRKTSRKRSKNN